MAGPPETRVDPDVRRPLLAALPRHADYRVSRKFCGAGRGPLRHSESFPGLARRRGTTGDCPLPADSSPTLGPIVTPAPPQTRGPERVRHGGDRPGAVPADS